MVINEEAGTFIAGKQRIASHALREKKQRDPLEMLDNPEKRGKKQRNWVEKLEDFMGILKTAGAKIRERLGLGLEFAENLKQVFFLVLDDWKTAGKPMVSGFFEPKHEVF